MKLNKTDEVCNTIFSRASYFLETETTVHFIKVEFQLKLLSKFLFCFVFSIFWKKPKKEKPFLNLQNDKLRFVYELCASFMFIFILYRSD